MDLRPIRDDKKISLEEIGLKTECLEDGYIICKDVRALTRFTTNLPNFVFRPNKSGETDPRDRLVRGRGE